MSMNHSVSELVCLLRNGQLAKKGEVVSAFSKMKESIESARYEFDNLKKALKDINYGEDTYKFILTPNSQKRNLYNMIMADDNLGTSNLFSGNFERLLNKTTKTENAEIYYNNVLVWKQNP